MKKIFVILAGLALGVSAWAAVPGSFKYQALVRDDNGTALVSKGVNVRVSLHQSKADGAVVYAETHSATTTQSGIVYLNIGEGVPAASAFEAVNWADGPYFMEVEVDKGSGYVNAGTQQLLSVPYAQFAKGAGEVVLTSPNGKQWKVIVDDNGNFLTNPVD